MAGEIESDIFGSINLSGFNGIGVILLWALVIILFCGVVYLAYYLLSFRNTLIIRDAANNRKIISKKNWKELRDKNNNIWLITPFNRIKKPLPPAVSVELTGKGRKWVEAWRGDDTETLIWITDNFDYDTYKDDNPDFQPLTTQERELIVNEISKSKEYHKKTTYEMVVQIVMIMAPIILIAVVAITLGDITEGLVKYSTPLTNTLQEVSANFATATANTCGIQQVPTIDVLEVPN